MDFTRVSHYRILEKLGAGGMGEVYLAEDMKLGRRVAIKILSEEYTTNRDRLGRFEQEACAASALNHPNILTIHEVGHEEGRHFIATEYIDGVTLRRKMASGPLEIREILDIAIQVASALEEAHTAGIVHRDIKPDNVMIRRNGYVKVLDFGLAKLTENSIERSPSDGEASTRVMVQTDAGVVMGTSHYMSPEQARGKPVDARSDIWSLGVLIYEMVAGRTPFEGETSTDVIVAITQKEPPPLARFAPNTPAELDWIITKALRKDRDERYQTIKELLTDLRRLRQRLEFEAELERSIAPETFTRSAISGVGATATVPERALRTSEKTVSHLSSAEYLVGGIKRHKVAALVMMLVFVLAIGGAIFFYLNRSKPLTDTDTILLTDFVNTTGEPVFDGTLKQALGVQLGQSPFLNIFPDERVRETLRFMGKSPDERITRDIGHEICERQGLKAMLSGSIASLGSHYVITLEALNAHTGDPIAREQVEAESKEKVLASLGTAASNLRKKLGESLSSIKKYDVNIEQATTSSLEALKAYASGNEQRAMGHGLVAVTFYKKAIELDPNFAMAYARVAVFYGNTFQMDQAQQYAEKAFSLRDRVSEREKFYISEKYYNYVTGEFEKAIEVLQEWAKEYPNDYIPHNNLGVNFTFLGRYNDVLKEMTEAVRLDPKNVSAKANLIDAFMHLNRNEEAQQILDQALQQNPDAGELHFYVYRLAFLRNDQDTMGREIEWFKGKPEEADSLDLQSAAADYYGKVKQGLDYMKRAAEMMKPDRPENAAQELLGMGQVLATVGYCQQARPYVASGLAMIRGRFSLSSAAFIYGLCGDVAQVQPLIEELQKRYPKDTPTVAIMIPGARAALEISRRNFPQAIELLEPTRRFEPGPIGGYWTMYLRGQAYLGFRDADKAAAEFQRIIDNRGIDVVSMLYPLAHLGLARAAAMKGDTGTSRKEYQDFLAAWKDADPDLPILLQARKEYEQLK